VRVCAIAGGVGSARFCAGLARVVDPAELAVVVNTGDDERIGGLHVSPDVDTVLYHLAGLTDWERGWGLRDESFVAHERYRDLAAKAGVSGVDLQEWFALGDRDLATHLLRTRLLDSGRSLTDAIGALCRGLAVGAAVLPMSDDPVRTVLATTDGTELDFQTYFVRRRHTDEIASVRFVGADRAAPAPGVLDAIAGADVVVIPPSNPLVSIAPVLSVPGIREAIAARATARVAVSPIVGGRALKGPADALMASLGHEPSALGVARIYSGLVDAFVVDEADASAASDIEALGMRPVVCDAVMRGPEDAARFAKLVLEHAGPAVGSNARSKEASS
jgi:LPPG:FO 2-phospho-L-lactate transferase